MKQKILISILVILIVLIIVLSSLYLIYNNTEKDISNTQNDNNSTNEEGEKREFLGLNFKNIILQNDEKVGRFSVIIENNTSNDIRLGKFSVILKDENEDIIGSMVGFAGDVIESGSSISLAIESEIDLTNVYSYELQKFEESEKSDDVITSEVVKNE